MRKPQNWRTLSGLILHIAIGGLMIAAGLPKILGLAPPEHVEKMGLSGHIRLIGVGELMTGILLLVPRTSSLGILLTSSFWGGAICIHMSHGEPWVLQSVFLVLSWTGAWLRNPSTLSSFSVHRDRARLGADEAKVAVLR
jgi:hypothetical protein